MSQFLIFLMQIRNNLLQSTADILTKVIFKRHLPDNVSCPVSRRRIIIEYHSMNCPRWASNTYRAM